MPQSGLVPRFGALIELLLKLTPYALARRVRRGRDMWRFNDWWVFGWLAAAAVAYAVVDRVPFRPIAFAVAVLGALRMWELTLYSLQAVFFVRERTGGAPAVPTVRRVALLSFVNFAEIVLWFAFYYLVLRSFNAVDMPDPAALVVLHHSLVEMVANSGSVKLLTPVAWAISIVHIMLGLFMTLVVMARIVSMLPRPLSMDPLENEADP
jgi:hypothetical protein